MAHGTLLPVHTLSSIPSSIPPRAVLDALINSHFHFTFLLFNTVTLFAGNTSFAWRLLKRTILLPLLDVFTSLTEMQSILPLSVFAVQRQSTVYLTLHVNSNNASSIRYASSKSSSGTRQTTSPKLDNLKKGYPTASRKATPPNPNARSSAVPKPGGTNASVGRIAPLPRSSSAMPALST